MKHAAIENMKLLSAAKSAEYEKLDAIVKSGMKTFLAVGHALVAIHANKFYLKDFKTFDEYAQSRGIKRRQAYNLMTAVQMTLELKSNVQCTAHDSDHINIEDVEKTSANSLIELSKSPQKKRAAIFKQASKKAAGPPTEKDIIEVAAEIAPRKQKPKKELPRGGLAADALRAKEPLPNPVLPPEAIAEATSLDESIQPITLAQCKSAMDEIKERIKITAKTSGEHQKFGVIINALANYEMNWRPESKDFNPYGK